jgi:cytochrome bd-type quinol oxidase subunit 1
MMEATILLVLVIIAVVLSALVIIRTNSFEPLPWAVFILAIVELIVRLPH